MKKYFLLLSTILICSTWMIAQESVDSIKIEVKQNLSWGGIDLDVNVDTQNKYFLINMNPKIGIHILKNHALGIHFPFNYGQDYYSQSKWNSLEFGVGIFHRFKFWNLFFTHFEVNHYWDDIEWRSDAPICYNCALPIGFDFNGGLGISISRKIGLEMKVLYNISKTPKPYSFVNKKGIFFDFGVNFNY